MVSAIKYYAFASHRKGHGIHSPFVYDFINNVLRKEVPPDAMDKITTLRHEMAESGQNVRVNDLGAGSQYLSSSCRTLSDISRISSVRNRYGRILYNIALNNNGKNILELGTSIGLSTLFLAMGAPDSRIISIEGCQNLAEIARRNISRCNIDNVRIIEGDFNSELHAISETGFSPSLTFIDGNHRKEPVLRYFALMKELIPLEAVIIFDDINYSVEMNEAWYEIKSDLQVSLSIDIFQMGFVFFRKGMVKQDFVIRY